MDRSGDGTIELKELRDGFDSVFDNDIIDKIIEDHYRKKKEDINQKSNGKKDDKLEETEIDYLEDYVAELEDLKKRSNQGE